MKAIPSYIVHYTIGYTGTAKQIWAMWSSLKRPRECRTQKLLGHYSNSFMGWQIFIQLCRRLIVRRKLTLLRESIPIRKWKLSHRTLCMSCSFTLQLISGVWSESRYHNRSTSFHNILVDILYQESTTWCSYISKPKLDSFKVDNEFSRVGSTCNLFK